MPQDKAISKLVLDRNGKLLRAFTVENGRWRLPIQLDAVDPLFLRMLLAYEDKRFYSHPGIDPRAVLRAVIQLVANGRIVSGGSTITMQLARLLEPRSQRSLKAKLVQAARGLQLERRLTKQQILEAYLTLAPYGGNIEGVRAASLAYFAKEPARLSPAEAALLIALPQLPEARRPDLHPEAARRARDRVLARVSAAGALSVSDAQAAQRQRLGVTRHPFPAFAAHSAEAARRLDPEAAVHRLTIDRDKQAALEQLARDALARLAPPLSVAMLLADYRTGEILARVGSPDFADETIKGYIDMTRAVRSPGSALKPFIYGLAFEDGLIHPSTLIDDKPSAFDGYRPSNFDMGYQGTVTAAEALQMSLNIPAVSLLSSVGPLRLMARLRNAGISPALPGTEPPGLAIALGGLGLTLEDLVAVFTALPRGGHAVTLQEIAPATASTEQPDPVLSSPAAWYVADILRGTPPPDGAPRRRLAYKTGTSYGCRDAWSVGFDGRYVLGVWVGRADGTAIPGLSGRLLAAPLLFDGFARVGGAMPLSLARPKNAYPASTAELPLSLQHFTASNAIPATRNGVEAPPLIVYPPRNARIDVGIGSEDAGQPLALKIQNGVPPFRWLVNGRPLPEAARRRTGTWQAKDAGFSTLTVIDAAGHSDSVTVFLE